ncbi:alpha/beta hydrolase [Mycolicibacterium farcinogenes]|uniref:Alpha/beta hydrolase n=1 Tax=Mycolicibacterium senegalense TaxID=1796 RepID=A0A378T170_9MYCO|nr:hypothetical protein [Mycolicibacterium senegalense]CDP82221.1 alpha/beta hydrolase [Mycolicibacterium farcinogenes]STZ54539.1 alpha/beta hydrolase [Mycolicibacterium senegalense]
MRHDSRVRPASVGSAYPGLVLTAAQRLGDLLGLAHGGFKSEGARHRYLTLYAEVRALSPPPDVVHDIETEFGTVRVYQHGQRGRETVVLVHGFFLTSAMWWEQVAGLSRDFTVYALDMLGQPGEYSDEEHVHSLRCCTLHRSSARKVGHRRRASGRALVWRVASYSCGGENTPSVRDADSGRPGPYSEPSIRAVLANPCAPADASAFGPSEKRCGVGIGLSGNRQSSRCAHQSFCSWVRFLRPTAEHTATTVHKQPSVAIRGFAGSSSVGGQLCSQLRESASATRVGRPYMAVPPVTERFSRTIRRESQCGQWLHPAICDHPSSRYLLDARPAQLPSDRRRRFAVSARVQPPENRRRLGGEQTRGEAARVILMCDAR